MFWTGKMAKEKSKTKEIVEKKDGFDQDYLLLSEKSSFSVQEAYKTLRTNVIFTMPGTGCKCIGITSADRGDGKSSVAINLAISFAQLKKRVLVIDCDMRLPTIAYKLNIKDKPGLSNLLTGQNDIREKLIYRVNARGIDVLVAGDVPPDPTVLLESKQMENLIAFLREHYDYIVFDFPPINVVSDAILLSKYMDGYFLIVRHNLSEYGRVNDVLRIMNFGDAKILGFVYNGKSNGQGYYRRTRKYYYKHNYYKGKSYGYGYGYGGEKK